MWAPSIVLWVILILLSYKDFVDQLNVFKHLSVCVAHFDRKQILYCDSDTMSHFWPGPNISFNPLAALFIIQSVTRVIRIRSVTNVTNGACRQC